MGVGSRVGERGEEDTASLKNGLVNESVLWETTAGVWGAGAGRDNTGISGFASVFENCFLNLGKMQEFYHLLRAIPCCSLLSQVRSHSCYIFRWLFGCWYRPFRIGCVVSLHTNMNTFTTETFLGVWSSSAGHRVWDVFLHSVLTSICGCPPTTPPPPWLSMVGEHAT